MRLNRWILSSLMALASMGFLFGQSEAPENWFTLDPVDDRVLGVSADKVYRTLLKDKPSKTVVVAVIDSGIDIEHEDLREVIWVNEDEIADNGKDDDNNGYVDDVYGWNFIGGKNGAQVDADTYEITREYVRLRAIYGDLMVAPDTENEEYTYWQEVKEKFLNRSKKARNEYQQFQALYERTQQANELLKVKLNIDTVTAESLEGVEAVSEEMKIAVGMSNYFLSQVDGVDNLDAVIGQLKAGLDYYEIQVKYGYNESYDTRTIVGDNYEDGNEIGYGNNMVEGPDAEHGTHVAGIVAAIRDNDLGIKGVAKNVKIMTIRAVPNGDERDKDVANAIRYAVDNGAVIINMSFGKSFTRRKELVDEAIRYAATNDVLCIHAAGNDGENLDESKNFPTPILNDGTRAENWLEVGASSWGEDETLAADFSNYGKLSVDLFAPGVAIYSAIPNHQYSNNQGTSMAAPAVTGVAAILRSYFPGLSAVDVKQVLEASTRTFGELVVAKPGTDGQEMVPFSQLSKTGGLVNAYEAVKLAMEKTRELDKR